MDEKTFDELWKPEAIAETEENLSMLKLKVKGTGNPYLLVQLLVRIGRAQAMQRKFDKAVDTMGEADFVLLEANQRDPHEHALKHRAWIRYMIERGRLFAVTGWRDSAQNYLGDACQMARDLSHFDLFKESVAAIKDHQMDVPRHQSDEAPSSPSVP